MALTRLLSVGATTALLAIALSTMSNPVELCAGQAQAAPDTEGPQTLDFEFFEKHVEPIFLEKRPGHARCYVCHGLSGAVGKARSGLKLEELSPGATFWTEEQSRRNFAVISKLVTPGEPLKSRLLLHPLATVAGGDGKVHTGGEQFASQDDPDWQILAGWVQGQKADGSSSRAADKK
jgi:hypothetical protein